MPHMLSPSKITAWMVCEHYLTLKFRDDDRARKNGFGNSDQNKTNEVLTRNEEGDLVISPPTDFADLLQKKGILHEQECLKEYKKEYPDQEGRNAVFEVSPAVWEKETFSNWTERVGDPNPLEVGYPIIFQMPFIHNGIRGIADFLEERDGTYKPVDSKLSRTGAKPGHLLQLLFYAEAVEANPAIAKRPSEVAVALGSGEKESFRVSEFWWYWSRLRRKLEKVVEIGADAETKPKKCSHCGICEYWKECESEWRKDDSLSFISGIHSGHKEALEEAGITTMAKLASLPKKTIQVLIDEEQEEVSAVLLTADMEEEIEENFREAMPKIDDDFLEEVRPELKTKQLVRLWKQARLQLISRENNLDIKDAPIHFFSKEEMKEKVKDRDDWKREEILLHLPECTDYDIYLDFEGHPFLTPQSEIIFLFGYLEKVDGEWIYQEKWSEDEQGYPDKDIEKEKARALVRFFYERYKECQAMVPPQEMHVYHYNHTERSLLGNLTTDADQSSSMVDIFQNMLATEDLSDRVVLDELVENGVFVDLLAVVRNSLQAGLESLSLKFMEQVAGFDRSLDQEGLSVVTEITSDSAADSRSDGDITQGAGAVFEYELYANHAIYGIPRDENRKWAIAKYNKEDVDATQLLHMWLLEQRREAESLEDAGVEDAPPSIFSDRIQELKEKILEQVSG